MLKKTTIISLIALAPFAGQARVLECQYTSPAPLPCSHEHESIQLKITEERAEFSYEADIILEHKVPRQCFALGFVSSVKGALQRGLPVAEQAEWSRLVYLTQNQAVGPFGRLYRDGPSAYVLSSASAIGEIGNSFKATLRPVNVSLGSDGHAELRENPGWELDCQLK